MTQNFGGNYYIYQNINLRTASEKKFIRRAGNAIGIVGIVMAIVAECWFLGVLLVTNRLGISEETVRRVVSNEGFIQFVQVLFSVSCFLFPFLIAAAILKVDISGSLPFKKVKKGTFLPYFVLGLSFCAFANVASSIASSIIDLFGFEYNLSEGELPNGIIGFLIFTISTAVVPAMAEEFGCRGILMGILRPMGDGFAIITSAAVFGLVHGNFSQIPFAFLVGIILGYIRVKTNSMIICMLVHFSNNFISVAIQYLSKHSSEMTINTAYTIYLAVSMGLAFFAVKALEKKDPISLPKADTEAGESQKLKWFFSSPAIIVFIVIELLLSMVYFFI